MSTATGERAVAQPELEKEITPGNTTAGNDPTTQAQLNTTTSDTSSSDNHNNQAPDAEKAVKPPGAYDASTIPNGGLQAWLQVAGGFSLFFNTFGLLNTFGIFQTYYESGALFTASSSNIAWIGSIQSFLILSIGCVTGPVYDRGYLRLLLLLGTFGVVFGFMMLSLSKTFWQALLSQGFCVGLGAGCLFVPGIAILPTYFTTRLGLAVGLAAAGSSMGGIIYPIVFYQLIDKIGFGWSVRVLAFISLGTLLVPLTVLKQRVKPAKARALIDWTAFTDVPYMIFTLAAVIGFIGLYIVLFYVSYYGQATGYTDEKMSFYLVPILNAASVFGRTVPNALSDVTGPLNMITPGALVVGILVFCLLAVKNAAGLIVVTAFYGFFSGVFFALPPVCYVKLTKDKSRIGTRIGMGFAMIGVAVLIGGPAGGAVLGTNANDLNWTGTWIFGGVTAMAAAAIFIGLRVSQSGWKLFIKA